MQAVSTVRNLPERIEPWVSAMQALDAVSGKFVGDVLLDVQPHPLPELDNPLRLYCAPIATQEGLLLTPLEASPGVYQRVGMIEASAKCNESQCTSCPALRESVYGLPQLDAAYISCFKFDYARQVHIFCIV